MPLRTCQGGDVEQRAGGDSDQLSARASLAKIREKSRNAQRKYRMKQRDKLSAAVAELEAVRSELEAVKLEKVWAMVPPRPCIASHPSFDHRPTSPCT